MKIPKNKIQNYSRRILQVLSFFIMPGLFASTFGAFRVLFVHVCQGTFTWVNVQNAVWILLATIPSTLVFGRFFCGWFCSFGAMGDFFWWISKGIRKHLQNKMTDEKIQHSPADNTLVCAFDRLGRSCKYLILACFVLLVWRGVIDFQPYSPWSAFGRLTSVKVWKELPESLGAGTALLVVILIASMFVERFFCRYLCPMGAIYAILSKLHPMDIRRSDDHCGSCSCCSHHCEMNLCVHEKHRIRSADCIKCMKCVEKCPRRVRAIRGNLPVYVPVLVTAVMIAFSQWGLHQTASNSEVSWNPEAFEQGMYTDGEYSGEARGYRGKTQVSVHVQNGNISKITVDAYEDDTSYFEQAQVLLEEILKTQSTEVDAVSGATLSSNGLRYAVEDALKQAVKPQEKKSSPDEPGKFDNGVHRGVAEAFRGEVELEVTVEQGEITDIRIISYYDNDEYFDQAMDYVISEIIESQDLNVDVVSGATYSSNGIIRAVADALHVPESDLTLKEGKELSSLHNKHGHVVKKYR